MLKYISLGFKGKKKKILNTIANYARLGGFMLASALAGEGLVETAYEHKWQDPFDPVSLITHAKEFVNAGFSVMQSIGMALEGDAGGLFIIPPILASTCISSYYKPGTSNVAGETLEKLLYAVPYFCGSDLLKKFKNKRAKKLGDFLNTFGTVFYTSMGCYIALKNYPQYINELLTEDFSPFFSSLNDVIAGEGLIIGGIFYEGAKDVRRLLIKDKLEIDKCQFYDADLGVWLNEDGDDFIWANKEIKISIKECELSALSKRILDKNPHLSDLEIILEVEKKKKSEWRNKGISGKIKRKINGFLKKPYLSKSKNLLKIKKRKNEWQDMKLAGKVKKKLKEFWNIDKYEPGIEGELEKCSLKYIIKLL